MDILSKVLLIAHFVALAAILGPWLAQLGAQAKRVTMTMVWGARAQLIIGLALAALASMNADEAGDNFHLKLGIKAAVGLAVVAFAEIGRKKDNNNNTFWLLVGIFTLVNVIVAVVV